MPTQGSFFGNFLAAFRAQSQVLPKAAPSVSTSAAAASSAAIWTAASSPQLTKAPSQSSEPIIISPKPGNPKTSSYNSAAPSSGQDRFAPLQHNVSPQTHLPRSPPSPGIPVHGPPNKPQPNYPTVQEVRRSRRGSDSSSEGFREVKGGGGEKWFIGGLTANGEERYYKLSMIKRDRSADRISTDQLSL